MLLTGLTVRAWPMAGRPFAPCQASMLVWVLLLFRPFEAAMPPPSHVHPGLLVTNKPDLPRPKLASPTAVGPACSLSRGSTGTADKCGFANSEYAAEHQTSMRMEDVLAAHPVLQQRP